MYIYDRNKEGNAANFPMFTMSGTVVMMDFTVTELTLPQIFSCTLASMLMNLTRVSGNVSNIVIRIPHWSEIRGMIQGNSSLMSSILLGFLRVGFMVSRYNHVSRRLGHTLVDSLLGDTHGKLGCLSPGEGYEILCARPLNVFKI